MTDSTYLSASTESNRTHGCVKRHYHTHVGTNGRFDSLQTAVIPGKWSGFEDEVKARGKIGARYSELLKDHVTTPKIAGGNNHVYTQYTFWVDENKRDELVTGMKKADSPLGIYYPKCFHEQPVFEYLGYDYSDFPESERASKKVFSLPFYHSLSGTELTQIINSLKKLII